MTDLVPLTALGAETPRRAAFGALTLTERPDIALASLALRRDAAVPAPFGLSLPPPGGMTGAEGHAAFWTAPGQWMLLGEQRAETDFAAALRAEAPGASVTEQTDGWVALGITAPDDAALERLIERLVNLPPEALAPGRATRTLLHHMPVFALRPSGSELTLLGMRSAAQSLWHALETAAARLAA
ncbi:sarcosine oxidase subunit gamma [Salipiger pacificus]|nr:sarcosine oxidase subunit gamma [Alloyangia pacifica]MCA0943794.1 sarcosine oxidase subunit gamma [Alloyangia pacifica]